MKYQSGSIGLCVVFIIACAAVYAVGYYGCNYMDDSEEGDLPSIESIQLTDIDSELLKKVK
jgi:hypothetical protein